MGLTRVGIGSLLLVAIASAVLLAELPEDVEPNSVVADRANIDEPDSDGVTPLWKAVRQSRTDRVHQLLVAGADPNTADLKQGWTPLQCNAFCNSEPDSLTITQQLLDHGADVHAVEPKYGETSLHYAVRVAKSVALVEKLLDAGADVNARSLQGNTPLQFAVVSGMPDMAKCLLKNGADPKLRNNKGLRPIDQINAISPESAQQIQKVFRQHGADAQRRPEWIKAERKKKESSATISGTIVLEDGSSSPVAGWLYAEGSYKTGKHSTSSWSSTVGQFTESFECKTHPGIVSLTFFPEDAYAPAVIGPFEIKPGETLSDVHIVLVPGHEQRVAVVTDGYQPIEGATVLAHPLLNGRAGGPNFPLTTDAKGEVLLEQVAPNTRYTFRVEAPGFQTLRTKPRRLPHNGEEPLRLWMVQAQPATGLVRFPDGSPAPGTKIKQLAEVHPTDGTDHAVDPKLIATTNGDGRFGLDSLSDDSRYVLIVEALDFNRVVTTSVKAGTQDAQIVLPERHDMVIRVKGDLEKVPTRKGKPYVKIYQRFAVRWDDRRVGTLFTDYATLEPTPQGGQAIHRGLAIDLRPDAGPQQVEVMLGQDESTKQIVDIARDADKATFVEFDLTELPEDLPYPRTVGVHEPDGSAMWFQSDDQVHFVVYYPGFFQDGLGGSNNLQGKWKTNGFLNLHPIGKLDKSVKKPHKLPIELVHQEDDLQLRIEGQEFDLDEGQIFIVDENWETRQMYANVDLLPGKQGDRKSVAELKKLISRASLVRAVQSSASNVEELTTEATVARPDVADLDYSRRKPKTLRVLTPDGEPAQRGERPSHLVER